MCSRASSRTQKKLDVMEKRIPRNPKYEEVQPVVDTGASMSKYLKKIEDLRTNYRIRKDEIFKRMKVTTFVQLMIQVAEINALEQEARNERATEGDFTARTDTAITSDAGSQEGPQGSAHGSDEENRGDPNGNQHDDTLSELMTTRSTLEGITRGVGEFDVKMDEGALSEPPPPPPVDQERPYLLLDCRTPDEFNVCHIVTAQNFPIAMLSRSCNFESKDMLAYRNQPGKIIVLYDEDERIAPKAATTMVERGYDNLFLLSGGMKVAYKFFPDGLLTGTIPQTILEPPKNNNKRKGTPPIISSPYRQEFTLNDLFLLNQQLDDALDDKTESSRLSRAATEASRSRVSQLSSRSNASTVTSRPPFR